MSDKSFAQLAYEAWCKRRARGKGRRVRFAAWCDLEGAQWDAWQAAIDTIYDAALRQLGIDLNKNELAPAVLQYPSDLCPMNPVFYTQDEVDALVESATDEAWTSAKDDSQALAEEEKAKEAEKGCPACSFAGTEDDADSR